MTPGKRKARQERARRMITVLRRLYPNPGTALSYTTDFELLVAVQLSAQCTDARVNEITKTLFKKYRTVDAYATVSQAALEKDVFRCGFYRNKARNIRAAAKMVRDEFGGTVPNSMDELLRIPGVARKTANVILSECFGVHKGIAVDTHVRRFAIRFDLTDHIDPVRIERDLMEVVPKKDWWHWSLWLIDYGREYCPARPHACEDHPLTKIHPNAAAVWPSAR